MKQKGSSLTVPSFITIVSRFLPIVDKANVTV